MSRIIKDSAEHEAITTSHWWLQVLSCKHATPCPTQGAQEQVDKCGEWSVAGITDSAFINDTQQRPWHGIFTVHAEHASNLKCRKIYKSIKFEELSLFNIRFQFFRKKKWSWERNLKTNKQTNSKLNLTSFPPVRWFLIHIIQTCPYSGLCHY